MIFIFLQMFSSSHMFLAAKQCFCKAPYCPRWIESIPDPSTKRLIQATSGFGLLSSHYPTSTKKFVVLANQDKHCAQGDPKMMAQLGLPDGLASQATMSRNQNSAKSVKMKFGYSPDAFKWSTDWEVILILYIHSLFCCVLISFSTVGEGVLNHTGNEERDHRCNTMGSRCSCC